MANWQRWSEDEKEVAFANTHSYDAFCDAMDSNGYPPRTESSWRSLLGRSGVRQGQLAEVAPISEPETEKLPVLADFDNIRDYAESVERVTASKLKLVDKPTTKYWTAPDSNWVGVVFIGDIHIGGLIDYQRLKDDLKLIEETEGLYAIGMGDYAENFERSGKIQHAMAENTVPGSDDQETLVRYYLHQCSKWLAVLAGNHDDWGGGKGIVRLAEYLGCEYVSQAGCSFKVSVGRERYVFYLKHQYVGNSRNSTSNEGRRLWVEWADFENADATILAHLHQPDAHAVERKGETVLHLRGGTDKEVDAWAWKGGYNPAYGRVITLLNPVDHEIIHFPPKQWRRGVQFLKALRNEVNSSVSR